MKAIIITIICMISSAFLFRQSTDESIFSGRGYIHKKYSIQSRSINTTLFVTIIDPSAVRVKIEGLTKRYSNGRRAMEVAKAGAKVVLGGGFMTSFYPIVPNGFLKIDGTIMSGLKEKGYNGLAGVKRGKLSLLTSSPESISLLDEGFQTGPFLVKDGKVVFKPTTEASRKSFNRAFVGITTQNKIIVGVTTQP